MSSARPQPLKVLRGHLNKQIYVRLKDGSEYMGTLLATDSTMNLVLNGCVELKPGSTEPRIKYGRALIRGSHVVYVSVDYEIVAGGSLPL